MSFFSKPVNNILYDLFLTSGQKKANPRLLTNNALFTIVSVICAMRIVSATHADTCINALKKTRDLPLGNTSEINMGGTQVTYLF